MLLRLAKSTKAKTLLGSLRVRT